MKQQKLRFRNLNGSETRSCFEQIKPSKNVTEAVQIKGNGKYIGFAWQSGGGGALSLLRNSKFCKLEPNHPKIIGHNGPVLDFNFNHFNDNFVSTASEDCKLRLWQIPDNFCESQQDLVKPIVEITAHNRKIVYLEWNPSSEYVIATGSYDNTVKVWNMQKQDQQIKIEGPDSNICLQWNRNGSMLGSLWKDKKFRLIDPRLNQFVLTSDSHQGPKTQKFSFLNEHYMTSCGFSSNNQREVALWDLRKSETRIQNHVIDSMSGTLYPHFDSDLGILYVWGQGNSNIKYYELSEGQIHSLSAYQSKVPQKAIGFYPKSVVNTQQCEVARALKLEDNKITIINFIQPRVKNASFQEDLYPDCLSQEPAQTAEDWFRGQNAEPLRVSMNPSNRNDDLRQSIIFSNNKFQEEHSDILTSNFNNTEKKDQELLEIQNKEIQEKNKELQLIIQQQQEKIDKLTLFNQQITQENQQLKKKLNQLQQLQKSQENFIVNQDDQEQQFKIQENRNINLDNQLQQKKESINLINEEEQIQQKKESINLTNEEEQQQLSVSLVINQDNQEQYNNQEQDQKKKLTEIMGEIKLEDNEIEESQLKQ